VTDTQERGKIMTVKEFERYLELKEIKEACSIERENKPFEYQEEFNELYSLLYNLIFAHNKNNKENTITTLKSSLSKYSYLSYKPEEALNQVKIMKEILYLIDTYDWKLMYSVYNTGDSLDRQIAVWEQNGDGQIRNHKTWNLK